MKMDKKLKAKWVKALRSGAYHQGRENLLYDGKYCCLGVLCRIAGAPLHRIKESTMPQGVGPTYDKLLRPDTQNKLASMNDGSGVFAGKAKTFREIADSIEWPL